MNPSTKRKILAMRAYGFRHEAIASDCGVPTSVVMGVLNAAKRDRDLATARKRRRMVSEWRLTNLQRTTA